MKEHIKILDFLRGFAALGVLLYHFGSRILPTIKSNDLAPILSYGSHGVQVFFVISGFVIPYSMYKSNYKLSNYFPTFLRRSIRICPPAYASILLSFALYYSSVLIINRPINGMDWPGFNISSIIGNLTFTVPYLNTMWFNPVFWTLALEFQFYILIGLLLPIITSNKSYLVYISLLSILLVGFINYNWFFKHSSFFILGIILFLKKEKLLNNIHLILISILTIVFCFFQSETSKFIFGLVTFLLIFFEFKFDFKPTNYLGKISYSLYITHSTVGIISEIILKRLIPIHEYSFGKIIMILVYTSISILFASIFYRFIEKQFILWSKKIKLVLSNNYR